MVTEIWLADLHHNPPTLFFIVCVAHTFNYRMILSGNYPMVESAIVTTSIPYEEESKEDNYVDYMYNRMLCLEVCLRKTHGGNQCIWG